MKDFRQFPNIVLSYLLLIFSAIHAIFAGGILMSFDVAGGNNAGAIVVTDKMEYERGEVIKIPLTNNLEHSIFSHIRSGTSVFCINRIERRTANGDWAKLYAQCQPPHCTNDIDAPGEIKQGETETMGWKPVAFVNGTSKTVLLAPGIYRLSISYENHHKTEWKSVYTNEFAILS